MKDSKLMFRGVANSLAITIYVTIVGYILNNGDKIFGKVEGIAGATAFLMLFVLSALIVGIFSIGKPLLLYLDGKKKEAVELFIYSLVSLFVLTLIALLILLLIK